MTRGQILDTIEDYNAGLIGADALDRTVNQANMGSDRTTYSVRYDRRGFAWLDDTKPAQHGGRKVENRPGDQGTPYSVTIERVSPDRGAFYLVWKHYDGLHEGEPGIYHSYQAAQRAAAMLILDAIHFVGPTD